MPDAPPPTDPARRAAALQALQAGRPPASAPATFWKQHGGKLIFAAALVLGVWLLARGVGRFMRTSVSETARSEEVIRRGVR
jgi:hypothetical protein